MIWQLQIKRFWNWRVQMGWKQFLFFPYFPASVYICRFRALHKSWFFTLKQPFSEKISSQPFAWLKRVQRQREFPSGFSLGQFPCPADVIKLGCLEIQIQIEPYRTKQWAWKEISFQGKKTVNTWLIIIRFVRLCTTTQFICLTSIKRLWSTRAAKCD